MGYTERNISGTAKVRYIEHAPTGIVFNLDDQYKHTERKYVLVTEGPIDAILVGGTALMGSEINPIQHQLIQRLNREIVVIPDRDHNGLQLINRAVEFGWSVSLPNWEDPLIKDVNDAVKKYGRLYTIYSIFNAIHSTKFKIELITKIWSKKINARGK